MTIFYLVTKILNVQNINLLTNKKIFCHNITQQKNNQDILFKMDNGLIHIIKKNQNYFAFDINRNKYFQLTAIHFCGNSKIYIKSLANNII